MKKHVSVLTNLLLSQIKSRSYEPGKSLNKPSVVTSIASSPPEGCPEYHGAKDIGSPKNKF